MALITRLSRLFSADLHAVLDRVEEPEIVLKQAVRDMQAAVSAAERQVRALESRRQQIVSARTAVAARLTEAGEELDVCLDAADDDLARSVIQRKLQLERGIDDLDNQLDRVRQALEEQDRNLQRRRHELEALRSKSEVFDSAPGGTPEMPAMAAVSRDEVEVALLREKRRRAQS